MSSENDQGGMSVSDSAERSPPDAWGEAVKVAALFAVDPAGLGGVVLRGLPGPVRDRWLSLLQTLLPEDTRLRRVPVHASDGRLLGGLDLSATLRAGHPIAEKGLLADADGDILLLTMAERLPAYKARLIAGVLDQGEVHLERDGFASREASRFGVVALDESIEDEDRPSPALRDRLAFDIDLDGLFHRDILGTEITRDAVAAAREHERRSVVDEALIEALTGTAAALGIPSLRAPLLALRAAMASAALNGRDEVDAEDAALAVRLVLLHRANRLPAEPEQDDQEVDDQPQPDDLPENEEENAGDRPLEDQLLEAALAALPEGLLDSLKLSAKRGAQTRLQGKAGSRRIGGKRGRPAGVRTGKPGGGKRLNVIETLRAAAPWQPLRKRQRPGVDQARIDVRPEDFRIIRLKERRQTTTIFVVDASGSSAFERLAEAKGAIELLLAECYTRRDQVALLAFRGDAAELLLPPTRSLVRAKRGLAGLPGGGGTPLAAAVQASYQLADAISRRGETPLLVFLTDGRANIARDGTPGRKQALAETLSLGHELSAAGHTALVIDISNRPGPEAERLAASLGGRYLPLPRADARSLSEAVMTASAP